MRRREFITLLGGAAAWPLAARAQQPTMPLVGFLYAGTAQAVGRHLASFRDGVRRLGMPAPTSIQVFLPPIHCRSVAGVISSSPCL
jgi:hypothetical protein